MALAIGDLEIIHKKWCQPLSFVAIGIYLKCNSPGILFAGTRVTFQRKTVIWRGYWTRRGYVILSLNTRNVRFARA